MAEVKRKKLVICADDFGMNSSIDAAVLRLGNSGRLNATSCLVDGSAFGTDAAALKASGLQMGLHLNFTEALGAEGLYLPISQLIVRAYLRRLDTARVQAQIVRQIERFERILGQPPDFVDGHQHVHQLPQIREALLSELERRYAASRPWLRYTGVRPQPGMPARQRLKARIIESLGARALARQARRRGFPMNGGFLGVYDFEGGEAAYKALLPGWLGCAADGDVLMCHPAEAVAAGDELGAQRVAEYHVLAGEPMAGWMSDHGLALA